MHTTATWVIILVFDVFAGIITGCVWALAGYSLFRKVSDKQITWVTGGAGLFLIVLLSTTFSRWLHSVDPNTLIKSADIRDAVPVDQRMWMDFVRAQSRVLPSFELLVGMALQCCVGFALAKRILDVAIPRQNPSRTVQSPK